MAELVRGPRQVVAGTRQGIATGRHEDAAVAHSAKVGVVFVALSARICR